MLRDRHPHRTVTATGTHNPISPSLSSSVIPFFRLANTGCALVCESHGYEVDLVARTYLQHRVIAGLVCVLLGDRSTRVYAPRITTTFFLGLLLYSLLHRAATVDAEPDVAATLLVFFAIILLGGLFQALFGLMRLGSLIKFDGWFPEHGRRAAFPGTAWQRPGLRA